MDRLMGACWETETVERAQKGDQEAMAQLLEMNQPLLRALAGRLCNPGPLLDELMQAVRRFDPGRGAKLTTYAVPWMLGEMKRALRCALESTGVQAKRAQLLHREKETACTLNRQLAMQGAKAMERPLSVEAFEEEGHALTGDNDIDLDRLALRMALPSLVPQERGVLLLRYYRNLTQKETARLLGKSQAQVSRIERRALAALRAAMS